ncbi:unnamed protein product [Arabidopsis lyrata]|uniref:vignain isoform X1 n=1 Tax=Arabidopsis lyrata subsp. lyrata TaxID=81972 RepID=UPI000A29AE9F|nr:vignain isoform X1 [Arabidopsis lyrata subsp. lyrata]CAH8259561.1 unnamed protein product [Arabidopsis lyrata]|eukprot:XP_002884569.2 vignain isoform X1 [Arabidopsis lyrata subsp. lyrata]
MDINKSIGAGGETDINEPIGAGGSRRQNRPKTPNPLNDPNRRNAARNEAQQQRPQDQQNQRQEFDGIAYEILKDWRLIVDLLGPIIEQREAICWAIVLARLIEAMYNIWIGDSKCFLRISVDDLVSKIKAEDDDKEITTLNRCIKVIELEGIKKVPTTSHANRDKIKTIKWVIDTNEAADRNFIQTKLEISPVGIIIDIDDEFSALREGFYKVRDVPRTGKTVSRHALMILGRGRTVEGQDFFIVQNSWEKTWGVNGYGRLIIDDGMSCMAFWPRPYRDF